MTEYRSLQNYRKMTAYVLVLALSVLLAGCPLSQSVDSQGKVAVVLKAGMLGAVAKCEGTETVSREDISSLYVTVDNILFRQETDAGSEMRSVLVAPLEVNVTELEDIGTVMASSSLPAGHYIGGQVILSSARLAFADAPDVFVPVALPEGGVLSFETDFTVAEDTGALLEIRLDDIEIHRLADDSLAIEAEFEFDANVEHHDTSDENHGGDNSDIAETVKAFGKIHELYIEGGTFKLKGEDHKLLIDFTQAEILLPPLSEGGDPVPGAPEDLREKARVVVEGTLTLDHDFVVLADSVRVISWAEDGNDGHDGNHGDGEGEHDGDEGGHDGDEGEHDGGEGEGEGDGDEGEGEHDGDEGEHDGSGGTFDEHGNTTDFGIPSGLVGNITAGTAVWDSKCAACHPSPFGAVGAVTYPTIETKLGAVALMSGVQVTEQQKADLTAYLNRASATVP